MTYLVLVAMFIAGCGFTSTGYWYLGIPMIGFVIWRFWVGITSFKKRSASKKEWKELVANAQYQHFEGHTGIAIDAKAKVIHLKHPFLIKSYPFSNIRSWRSSLATGGEVRVYGGIGGLAAAQASAENLRVLKENIASSGFYVTVKDIENPEWRTAMYSQKDMKKWMEIFEQHVNQN